MMPYRLTNMLRRMSRSGCYPIGCIPKERPSPNRMRRGRRKYCQKPNLELLQTVYRHSIQRASKFAVLISYHSFLNCLTYRSLPRKHRSSPLSTCLLALADFVLPCRIAGANASSRQNGTRLRNRPILLIMASFRLETLPKKRQKLVSPVVSMCFVLVSRVSLLVWPGFRLESH